MNTQTSTSTVTPLTPARVTTIMNDILDSYLVKRKQSSEEVAEVTRKIARSRKASVQQVAGVRASLSLGRYGTMATLLRNRRKATS